MKKSILKISVIMLLCITTIFCTACFDLTPPAEESFELVGEISGDVEYVSYLGYSCELSGILRNKSNYSYSYVSIEFSLYDADGNNLGTALASVNNIGPGETWRFTATLLSYPSTEPVSYKVANIYGW